MKTYAVSLILKFHPQNLILYIRPTRPTVSLPCFTSLPRPTLHYSDTKNPYCSRCGRIGHIPTFCYAKYSIEGDEIESDPLGFPEDIPYPTKVY